MELLEEFKTSNLDKEKLKNLLLRTYQNFAAY